MFVLVGVRGSGITVWGFIGFRAQAKGWASRAL